MNRALIAGLVLLLSASLGAQTLPEIVNQAINKRDYSTAILVLQSWLGEHQEDLAAILKYAQVLSWQGRLEEAMKQYEYLLNLNPDNVDALFGQAQVYVWDLRETIALPLLAKARKLAPDYLDIWRVELTILMRLEGVNYRHQHTKLLGLANLRFPEHDWRPYMYIELSRLKATKSWFEFEANYTSLTANRRPWRHYAISIGQQYGDSSLSLRLQQERRFAWVDHNLSINGALPISNWLFEGGLAVSPSPRIMPKNRLHVTVSRSLTHASVLAIGIKYTRYNDIQNTEVPLRYDFYWSNYSIHVSHTFSSVNRSGSESLAMRYYYANSYMGFMLARGKELEYDGEDLVAIYNNKGFSIVGRHYVSARWSLFYTLAHHKQGNIYDRNGITTAIRYQF